MAAVGRSISFFQITILILSFYVLGVLVADSFFLFSDEMKELLNSIDLAVCAIFFVDFIISFVKAENKLKYLRWGWIDLVSCFPAIGVLRAGRALKMMRILRAIRGLRSMSVAINSLFEKKAEGAFKTAIVVAVLLILFSSITVLYLERGSDNLSNGGDVFWWTTYTMMGMDYCQPPSSSISKGIAIVLSLSGMSILGTFTAYIADNILTNNKK